MRRHLRFTPEGDTIIITLVSKQTCPLLWSEIDLYLLRLCSTPTSLKKQFKTKGSYCVTETWENHGELFPNTPRSQCLNTAHPTWKKGEKERRREKGSFDKWLIISLGQSKYRWVWNISLCQKTRKAWNIDADIRRNTAPETEHQKE